MKLSRRSVIVAAAVVATASFFSAAFGYAYWSSEGWYEQCIDVCDTGNYLAAIATDSSGTMHVAYHGKTDGLWMMKHATRVNGKWKLTDVGGTNDRIQDLKISVDDESNVHVSWCSAEVGFSYASGTAEGFQTASVNIEDFYSGAVSMDSAGVAHGLCSVKHWNDSSDIWEWEFQHWTISSGEWLHTGTYAVPDNTTNVAVIEVLVHADHDPTVAMSFWSSYAGPRYLTFANLTDAGLEFDGPYHYIAEEVILRGMDMDSHGNIHLAVERTDRVPMYEHWYLDGEHWTRKQVDYVGERVYWNSLDLFIDDQDTVYLTYLQTYYSFDVSRLRVAKDTAAGWDISTLDSGPAFGFTRPVLTTSPDGTYHIVHYVFDGHNQNLLMYADSDSDLVLTDSLKTALLQTSLMAVIVWPSTFAMLRWRAMRAEKRQRLEKLGLYEHRRK
jgi:hypothetical protein